MGHSVYELLLRLVPASLLREVDGARREPGDLPDRRDVLPDVPSDPAHSVYRPISGVSKNSRACILPLLLACDRLRDSDFGAKAVGELGRRCRCRPSPYRHIVEREEVFSTHIFGYLAMNDQIMQFATCCK